MYDSNIVIHEASRTESPTVIPFSHEASTRSGLGYILDGSDCIIRPEGSGGEQGRQNGQAVRVATATEKKIHKIAKCSSPFWCQDRSGQPPLP
ncbi:hypothetical protein T11_669 [Trichinella zimbabwensis]|uniref:Uncharacterized protein n=1 Tax=Trichinella zimbabwensis TaxID=268475 RepID=A0A0V1HCY8_9BILA|nr:hypothetical protein T11_669 [Trichinella zimbabwensis]